ncbi:MAG: hypothetical protein Kow00128_02830 [Deltaproteobacteria bacterium]
MLPRPRQPERHPDSLPVPVRRPGRLQDLPHPPNPAGSDGHPFPELRTVPDLPGQRPGGAFPVLFPPADQRDVATRGDRPHGRLADAAEDGDGPHFQCVREEDPAEPEVSSQQVGQDLPGKGGGAVPVQRRVDDVGGHQRGDPGADRAAEGEQIPGHQHPPAVPDGRQRFVGIGVGGSVAGEMLADGEDSPGQGAPEEGDAEPRRLGRIVRQGAGPDHRVVRAAVHVQHRGEVDVHPHRPKLLRDRLAGRLRRALGPAGEGGIAASGREPGEPRLGEPLDPASLLVDGDQRRGAVPAGGGADLPAEFPDLPRGFRIAGEEDHAEQRSLPQHAGDRCRQLFPLEPGHQGGGRERGRSGGHRTPGRDYFTDPIVKPAMNRSRKKV